MRWSTPAEVLKQIEAIRTLRCTGTRQAHRGGPYGHPVQTLHWVVLMLVMACFLVPGRAQNCPEGFTGPDCDTCLPGYIQSGLGCSPCPPGSYSDVNDSTECASCPQGSYSDVPSSTSCTPCPEGSTTASDASTQCGVDFLMLFRA